MGKERLQPNRMQTCRWGTWMSKKPFVKSYLDDPREQQRDACGVGFIAHLKGERSHRIVIDGLEILRRMDHRGGRAADGRTSDGAGLFAQIPHELIQRSAHRQGKNLPAPSSYALAMSFLPQSQEEQHFWQRCLREQADKQNLELLFLRDVPVDASVLGPMARATLPHIQQSVFVSRDPNVDEKIFDWRLFIMRKNLESLARERYGLKQRDFYIVSLSRESVCYKALTTSDALGKFYLDLVNPNFTSAYAMTHLRFSTNTLPSWPLAQPFRTLCHNGEINTLRGNINAMHARSFLLKDDSRASDLESMGPICTPGMSDSAMLDNAVEFLLHSDRALPHVLSMFIPEPWEKNDEMNADLKDFYEYQSYLVEPWDGPALIAFSHKNLIGAILDRNGLRPGRYWLTADHHVIMASEAGVLDRSPENIIEKGRLAPGRIFLVDMKKGAIVSDEQIKNQLSRQKPYGEWLQKQRVFLEDLCREQVDPALNASKLLKSDVSTFQALKSFAFTKEDLRVIIAPMANDGKEPDGSMGTDTPLAVLSKKRPLLYNYFKQLFAQVTNPPIDAIREELVTSLATHLGGERNLLQETPAHCSVVRLRHPILTTEQMRSIESSTLAQLKVAKLDATFALDVESLESALEKITELAIEHVRSGADTLIISDLGISKIRAAIPALLATSAIHHALIRAGERTRCSLIVESGEPREVHHFALLIAYGASAVNPYLTLSIVEEADASFGFNTQLCADERTKNYVKAVCDGLLKIMSKMGISTLHSYRGGQIFEALGLSQTLVDQHFTWTPSRIGGIDLIDIEEDVRAHHQTAFVADHVEGESYLEHRGEFQWRADGEEHLHSPSMIAALQNSVRINSRFEFKKFCQELDEKLDDQVNLRSLLSFKQIQPSIDVSEVESVESLVKRFSTGAMSFGSISKEAHETIAIAMNRLGARSNSGEGGEDPARFTADANGDLRNSAIKQVASARFGVTASYLNHANELQIKIAQGAKPGEGGQLPGHKVDAMIGKVRHSTPGITLISPPPHHDIYSIEDLAQLIYDLKNANRQARISVKLVSESGIGTIAAGVAKSKADVILVSGYEGGTGASPVTSIKHAGLPWELGLTETHRTLVENHLRERVILQADGQLRTPRDLAIATLLGAEEWGIATGALITLGCIMMRKCHLNTCPVGIATQNPELRKKFAGQPEHLINYIFLLAEGLRDIMAELGFRTVEEMVGRFDALEKNPQLVDPRLQKIDVNFLLQSARIPFQLKSQKREKQEHGLDACFDVATLLPAIRDDILNGRAAEWSFPIANTDRAVGTLVSSEISKKFGDHALPEDLFQITFHGTAGQSFMAFAVSGLSAVLIGEANDYLCKGLSGGKVVVVPDRRSTLIAENNIICGNTVLYGATAGQLYVRGRAGERFAVRNSGAHAVVEGIGDHGCEYMTGGSVVVLGSVGRNFAAGMSGGVAFIYDPLETSAHRINRQLVDVECTLSVGDQSFLRRQIEKHCQLTNSRLAKRILDDWQTELNNFVFVVPAAYKAIWKSKSEERISKKFDSQVRSSQGVAELNEGGLHG